MYTPILLNCVLLVTLYLAYIRRREVFSIGGIIFFLYAISSVCALLIVKDISFLRNLEFTFYPVLYFFTAFVVFSWPFWNCDKNITEKLNASDYDYKPLVLFYIFAAIVETILVVPKIRLMDFADLALAYSLVWEDVDANQLYEGGLFQGIVFNTISYFRFPMIIIFFTYLSRKDVSKLLKISLFLAIFVPNLLWAIRTVSRAKLVLLFIPFLFCYILFKEQLSSKIKKNINITLVSFSTLLIAFFFILTLGRFSDNASDSLLYYLGHPSLIYNGATVSVSEGNMGGQIYLDWFYDKFGWKTLGDADDVIGTTAEASFKTFIGTRYIDFGPIGAILYGIFLSSILAHLLKKRRLGVAELYIYILYANWLFIGAFYDDLKAVSWIMAAFIYVVLKTPFIMNKKKK